MEDVVETSHVLNPVSGNRLCLDFVNLPFTSGDPVAHATSWLELVDFLSDKGIVSRARSEELSSLTESDPKAAGSLLAQARRLGQGMRTAFRAMLKTVRIQPEGLDPINETLRVTEGYDQLEWVGRGGRVGFVPKPEGLEGVVAAVGRVRAV